MDLIQETPFDKILSIEMIVKISIVPPSPMIIETSLVDSPNCIYFRRNACF